MVRGLPQPTKHVFFRNAACCTLIPGLTLLTIEGEKSSLYQLARILVAPAFDSAQDEFIGIGRQLKKAISHRTPHMFINGFAI
jgi:hypothetical protein